MKHPHCLSAEPHEENIKEVLLHFLGCLPFNERHGFLYDEAHPVWRFEAQHNESGVTQKREKWQESCLNELRRIEFLREKLKDDKDESQLVSDLDTSREEWRKSTEYHRGMELVKQWKQSIPQYTQAYKPSDIKVTVRLEEIGADYKPERDVNVPIIKFKGGEAQDFDSTNDGKMVWGKFPDQKTTVEHLLERKGEENILYREKADSSTIKYFHLPSNNMHWAEEAISRYFNEEKPEFHKLQRKIGTMAKTEAATILQESYWRGQLHGGQLSINSRFMQPFCEAIYSTVTEGDPVPKDIVLFMPYIHWETSRMRERFARKTDQIVDKYHYAILSDELEEKQQRQSARQLLHVVPKTYSSKQSFIKPWYRQLMEKVPVRFGGPGQEVEEQPRLSLSRHATLRRPMKTPMKTRNRIHTLGSLVEWIGYTGSPVRVDETGRVQIIYNDQRGLRFGSPLGQYLIDAARMFEAMTNYRDKCLLEKYLLRESPLHQRRALDQVSYKTLNSTRLRGPDQVVYRATTAKGSDFHKYDFKTSCWPAHSTLTGGESCRDCPTKIRKISRLLMVDQLWMWILDANTIITCFPDRYGTNSNHSPSGVHGLIRSQIMDKDSRSFGSVFELSLAIIEACSKSFLDRTETAENQPPVIETFTETIENIMHRQTLARGNMHRWLDVARRTNKSSARIAGSNLVDIKLEISLDAEVTGVIEELGNMLQIQKTQRELLKQFIAQVKNILDPHGQFAGKAGNPDASRQRLALSRLNTSLAPEVRRVALKGDELKGTFDSFNINADETLTRVNDRVEQLEELQRIAQIAASRVKDLLEVKQQQASIVQAWQSTRQSDETNEQGRAIMIFTIVTIIFLPLSFMSSVFGMNSKEFGGDENLMHLADQIRYIVVISVPIIFLTFLLSLNASGRSPLALIVRRVFFWIRACYAARVQDLEQEKRKQRMRETREAIHWGETASRPVSNGEEVFPMERISRRPSVDIEAARLSISDETT